MDNLLALELSGTAVTLVPDSTCWPARSHPDAAPSSPFFPVRMYEITLLLQVAPILRQSDSQSTS